MCACFVCVGVLLFSDWPEGDGVGGAVGGANRSPSSTRISTAGRLSINNKMRKKISRDQKIKTKKKKEKSKKNDGAKSNDDRPRTRPRTRLSAETRPRGGRGEGGGAENRRFLFCFSVFHLFCCFFFGKQVNTVAG